MRKLIIIPILLVISIVLVILIQQKKNSDKLPANIIFSSGTVEASTVTVSAQIAGKVIDKRHSRGEQVKVGDTLLLLERDLLEAKLKELAVSKEATEAEYNAASIDLGNQKKNLKRTEEAFKVGSIPEASLDNLSSAVKAGESRLTMLASRIEMLETQRETVEIQLSYTVVTSPAAGYIQSDPVTSGEVVTAGSALFEIIDLSETWVEVYIHEAEISNIHLGDTAEIYLDAYPDSAMHGLVSFISQEAEFTPKNVQTKKERVKQVFAVRINVDNRSGRFKPALPVDVYLKRK